MFFEFSLGLRTADFLFSIRHIASNTVHRDILSLGLLRSLWFKSFNDNGREERVKKAFLVKLFNGVLFAEFPLE
jgi:hypothetical protein